MDATNEKVFIAWGGNQPLAKAVSEKISKYKFSAIVGGGQVTDLYLGNQILTQMRQCTQAVILVQRTSSDSSKYNLNDNMMFEWGYLTSQMPPNKIHVFLIDMQAKHLPSDLMGTWATEIIQSNRTMEDVAEEVARTFHANASIPIEVNKMEVLHTWERTKRLIENYNESSNISDVEMAHILLHSIETNYQYMEDEYTEKILNNMKPISNLLAYVVQLFKVNITLVRETNHLTSPIDFDLYEELKSICSRDVNFIDKDENLNMWIQFYKVDHLIMLHSSIATNPELRDEEKSLYIKKSVQEGERALDILQKIISEFPRDKNYVNLFVGYIHGHLRYHCYSKIECSDKASYHSKLAVDAFRDFYLTFKQLFPGDGYLINQFAQTYYLDLARHADYVSDAGEQMMIRRMISSFLSKYQQQAERQHKIFKKLKDRAKRILKDG